MCRHNLLDALRSVGLHCFRLTTKQTVFEQGNDIWFNIFVLLLFLCKSDCEPYMLNVTRCISLELFNMHLQDDIIMLDFGLQELWKFTKAACRSVCLSMAQYQVSNQSKICQDLWLVKLDLSYHPPVFWINFAHFICFNTFYQPGQITSPSPIYFNAVQRHY